MKSICFFNCYHNGDVFNSKAFVTEIMRNIDTKYYYAHNNNPKIIADLPIEQINLSQIENFNNCSDKFIITDDVVYVNTWIGPYFEPNGECTLRFSYYMYGKIYEELNRIFGSSLSLGKAINYFPKVDYSFFPDVSKVDAFLAENNSYKKKILISNGPGHSNQVARYNEDMSDIIDKLAEYYSYSHSNYLFIATHKYDTKMNNVRFTDDIIQAQNGDLNEISYLSKFCDFVIGRSSGPYSFSCTYDNMNDETKTFFCFGDRRNDCFQVGIEETKNKFIFHTFQTKEILYENLEKCLSV